MKLINNIPPFKTMSVSTRRKVLEKFNLMLVAIIWIVLFTVLIVYAPKDKQIKLLPDLPISNHAAKFF